MAPDRGGAGGSRSGHRYSRYNSVAFPRHISLPRYMDLLDHYLEVSTVNARSLMSTIRTPAIGCALILALAGCAKAPPDAPVPSASTEGAANATASAATASANPLEPRYEATLSDGISFSKGGYPNFVADVKGISNAEQWGRWTDATLAPSAVVKLVTPVSGNATLHLKMRDFFGINKDQKIPVRFGDQKQEIDLTGDGDQVFDLKFTGLKNADEVEITPAKTSEPKAADARKMGVGLIELSIKQ